jgi:hypothetical protein
MQHQRRIPRFEYAAECSLRLSYKVLKLNSLPANAGEGKSERDQEKVEPNPQVVENVPDIFKSTLVRPDDNVLLDA